LTTIKGGREYPTVRVATNRICGRNFRPHEKEDGEEHIVTNT